jgi:hypothetical protein
MFLTFYIFLNLLSFQDRNFDRQPILQIEKDTIKIYNDDLSIKSLRIIKNPKQIPFEKFEFKIINNEIYFFGGLSGEVYTIIEDSLNRLDATPDHRLNITSNIFVNNDTIFKYGGYGYWSQRNFNIYFDFQSKEWQVYKTSKKSYNPIGSFYGLYLKSDEGIYFFGGKIVDETNRINQIKSEDVLYFDFKSKTFEKLGTSESEFNLSHYLVHDNEFVYLIKDTILYQVSPKDNTINLYSYPNKLWGISKERNFNTFKKDRYYIEVNDPLSNKSKLISLTKEELIKNPLGSIKLYNKELDTKPALFSLILFLVSFLFFMLLKIIINKKQILLKDASLVFKNIHYSLEKEEIAILKKLITAKRISTKEVIEIIEKKEFSYVHNTRIKDKIMKDLNLKLKMIFNFHKPPIIEMRSSEDRRNKLFCFDETTKNKMSKIKIL